MLEKLESEDPTPVLISELESYSDAPEMLLAASYGDACICNASWARIRKVWLFCSRWTSRRARKYAGLNQVGTARDTEVVEV